MQEEKINRLEQHVKQILNTGKHQWHWTYKLSCQYAEWILELISEIRRLRKLMEEK